MKKKSDLKDIIITASVNNVSDVIPQTDKAKAVFQKEDFIANKSLFCIHKADAIDVLAWAVSHGLSVDSRIPMMVKPKQIA